MNKLQDKVAIITGGNSGIGLATAKRFVLEGAKVVIIARRKKELEAAQETLGSNVMSLEGDVSRMNDLDRIYAKIKEVHGKIDIIFANAGIALYAPLFEVTETHFDEHFNINVKGLFFTVQKALPLMNNGGAIILNSSIAGFIGRDSAFSVYSATKAAVRSFARTLTHGLKDRRIRVNAISPGPVRTPIFSKLGISGDELNEFETKISEEIPLGRMGSPDEIASAVAFLASNESSYITGINLCLDGGLAQI